MKFDIKSSSEYCYADANYSDDYWYYDVWVKAGAKDYLSYRFVL